MDDEGGSWLDEIAEETKAVEGAPTEGGVEAASAEPKEIVWARPPPAPVREKDSGDIFQIETNKRIFTHWARPIFLQYDYLYRYQHSYYDDWIDYLDKRQRGLAVEPPKPQTWAERALRGYTRDYYPFAPRMPRRIRPGPDSALLYTTHWANTWHSVHSKDYFNRKYKEIMF